MPAVAASAEQAVVDFVGSASGRLTTEGLGLSLPVARHS